MLKLVSSRIVQAVPLLFLVSIIAFGLGNATPVDPARLALTAGGTGVQVDERDVERKRQELGLDRPVVERYIEWMKGFATGDLGESYLSGRSVYHEIRTALPASLLLGLLAITFASLIGLPFGVFAARNPGAWPDVAARAVSLLTASIPAFWLALLSIWLFAAYLGWLPALGSMTKMGVVLPVLVLGLRPIGGLLRLMRASSLEVLQAEFVKAARGRGLTEPRILGRHVAPNAGLSVLAVIGIDLAAIVGEAAVVEWVFAWPGLGRLGVEAARGGDLPMLMAFTMVVSTVVVLINLGIDVITALLDPRTREYAR